MTEEKKFEDLTVDEKKNIKIEFAPGAFDTFEGTQEELDELIVEIQRMITSGELFEKAEAIDMEALIEEDPEFAEQIMNGLDSLDGQGKRTLQ